MATSEFQPGEIVDIAIKGVRIAAVEIGEVRNVRIIDDEGHKFAVPPQAAITRVAPAEWPPKRGDLWSTHSNRLWFAITSDHLIGEYGEPGMSPNGLLTTLGPLTLVHRVGWSPAGPDDAAVDDLARDLSNADVEINGGDYPGWSELHNTGHEQYRAAARFLLARYQVVSREQQDGGDQT